MNTEIIQAIIVIVFFAIILIVITYDSDNSSKADNNDNSEVILTRDEIIKELTDLGVKYDKSDNNEELMNIYIYIYI